MSTCYHHDIFIKTDLESPKMEKRRRSLLDKKQSNSCTSRWVFFVIINDCIDDNDCIDEDMDDEAHFQMWIGWISPENSILNPLEAA